MSFCIEVDISQIIVVNNEIYEFSKFFIKFEVLKLLECKRHSAVRFKNIDIFPVARTEIPPRSLLHFHTQKNIDRISTGCLR